ncbi:MAG: hypothetical protein V1881_03105 [Candidatus Micrarchaeota archaeon]
MKKPTVPFVALPILITAALLVSGCVGQAPEGGSANPPDDGAPIFNGDAPSFNGTPRNMTDAERQQMETLRTQACSGKAEGAACEMQNQRGAMNGTCRTMNGALACEFAGNRTRGAPGGNFTDGEGPQRMRPTPAA